MHYTFLSVNKFDDDIGEGDCDGQFVFDVIVKFVFLFKLGIGIDVRISGNDTEDGWLVLITRFVWFGFGFAT